MRVYLQERKKIIKANLPLFLSTGIGVYSNRKTEGPSQNRVHIYVVFLFFS